MKNSRTNPVEQNHKPLQGLGCKLFGHKYRITRRYESQLKEFECAQCKKQFTLDGYGHYTPLTPKLKKLNQVFENYYSSKQFAG